MTNTPPATIETGPLLEFMIRLGQAYLASGEQTAEVELILRRAARAYGMKRSRIVAFPTALLLSLHDEFEEHVTVAEGPVASLRLDQIAAVYQLGELAQRGEISPQAGLLRLVEIMEQPPRFGVAGAIGGHAILSIGLAMVLMPSVSNLTAAAILGAIVGWLKMLHRDRPLLAVHMPVVAAVLVSALVFLVFKAGLTIDPLYALVPPLVTFLPGARLTLGMVELAYGDMVSGSSRLMTGFVNLLLLAFGLSAGAMLVGYSAKNLVDVAQQATLEPAGVEWAAWIGVPLFALGVYFHFSAPKGALVWMLVVSLVAFGVQQLAVEPFGKTASGFFGMLVVTPLAYLIQLRCKGPPAMVTFLPSFWVLVPGALSLQSVKYLLSDADSGVESFVTALFAIVAIALGTLIGASLYKWVHESTARWKSQWARVLRRLGQKSNK